VSQPMLSPRDKRTVIPFVEVKPGPNRGRTETASFEQQFEQQGSLAIYTKGFLRYWQVIGNQAGDCPERTLDAPGAPFLSFLAARLEGGVNLISPASTDSWRFSYSRVVRQGRTKYKRIVMEILCSCQASFPTRIQSEQG